MSPFPWPPTFPGLETPDFLRTVRGDFPPDAKPEAEDADPGKGLPAYPPFPPSTEVE